MTVAIISRFALMRKMLRGLLATMKGPEVVLDADSAFESFELIDTLRPRILLIDTVNPVEDLATVRQLRKLYPAANIILLVESADEQFELHAIEAGARGCVSKKSDPQVLEKALNLVEQGQFWISRGVASLVAGKLSATHDPGQDLSRELTQREWAVLGLLAMGHVNKEIAARLAISENTVKAHLASTYRKLAVTTRLGAVLHYFRHARDMGARATAPPADFPKALAASASAAPKKTDRAPAISPPPDRLSKAA